MNKCKKHPKYKAKMRPRVICSDCADIYKNKTGKDYLIFLKEKPIVGKPVIVKGHELPDIIVDDYIPARVIDVSGVIKDGYSASIKNTGKSKIPDIDFGKK